MLRGKLVDTEQTSVEKFGKTWTHTVKVYHIHQRYNVSVRLEEANTGLFRTGEQYGQGDRAAQDDDDLQETIDELTQELFEEAASRSEARDLDLSIQIE